MPSMTLLNATGDVTITWDEDKNPEMLALIDKKIKEGYSFFVVKKYLKVINVSRKVKNINDVKDRKITIADDDVQRLFNVGAVSVVDEKTTEHKVISRAKNALEVVKNNTLAVKPMYGG